MSPQFLRAFEWLIKWEGSEYEDVEGDPGGPTKYGIDQRSHPEIDIKDLTIGEAETLYWTEDWLGNQCDKLPSPLAETYFNFCVNTGPARATRFLQSVLGTAIDGVLGPITIAAANASGPEQTSSAMIAQADTFYIALGERGMKKFVAGWLNRTHDLSNQLSAWTNKPNESTRAA
jgi:lysozyme family protein